jgi:site-specific recombinase XerD
MSAQESPLPLDLGFRKIVDAWSASDAFTGQTRTRATETLGRFTTRASKTGVATWQDVDPRTCAGFITAHTSDGRAAELATQHARRTVLRMAFRTLRDLGHPVGDLTIDVVLPARSTRQARPLTDDEIVLCRVAARLTGPPTLRRAVTWALAEATAVTSEIPQVRICDLDDSENPRRVRLAGNQRHDPRWGMLTDWGATVISRHVQALREKGAAEDDRLVYRGKADPSQDKAQASACNAVGHVLDTAGFTGQADVRPASIRGWIGRTLYEQGHSLQDVALALGNRSLDATADAIGLDWRNAGDQEVAS